ncbi:MAG: hypothetical protein RBS91_08595 [Sulfurimonadaceae bacterium]|jgi:hypothetical protein|nr:hypothetical protein [Sulfurimonadaceae bacterium]
MKTKIVKTKDGEKIKLEIIEKFDNYRGFYFLHKDGVYTKANYNSASLENIQTGYSRGYVLEGRNCIEHLYLKIAKGSDLSRNERDEFYEKINLRRPVEKASGVVYDFRDILHKKENVQFWTLLEKFSKVEIEIYQSTHVEADPCIW